MFMVHGMHPTPIPHRQAVGCVLRTDLRCMECTLPGNGGQHVPGQEQRQLKIIPLTQVKQSHPYRIAGPVGAGLP